MSLAMILMMTGRSMSTSLDENTVNFKVTCLPDLTISTNVRVVRDPYDSRLAVWH